jgi:hypothetical protein
VDEQQYEKKHEMASVEYHLPLSRYYTVVENQFEKKKQKWLQLSTIFHCHAITQWSNISLKKKQKWLQSGTILHCHAITQWSNISLKKETEMPSVGYNLPLSCHNTVVFTTV